VLPNIPGFLVAAGFLEAASVSPFFISIYTYAWFVGFFLAGIIYLAAMFTVGGGSRPEAH